MSRLAFIVTILLSAACVFARPLPSLAGQIVRPPPEKPALSARFFPPPIPPPPPLPMAKLCPMPSPDPWQTGEASHYADMLAGYRTAFGGTYDPEQMTAAHRTLPEGARILVRNLDNRKSAVLTITDRGPFSEGGALGLPRVLDVSGRAARALAFHGGLARVAIFRCGASG